MIKSGSTVEDLAKDMNSDLAKGTIYAIDIRDGLSLAATYELKDRDVVPIVSTRKEYSLSRIS